MAESCRLGRFQKVAWATAPLPKTQEALGPASCMAQLLSYPKHGVGLLSGPRKTLSLSPQMEAGMLGVTEHVPNHSQDLCMLVLSKNPLQEDRRAPQAWTVLPWVLPLAWHLMSFTLTGPWKSEKEDSPKGPHWYKCPPSCIKHVPGYMFVPMKPSKELLRLSHNSPHAMAPTVHPVWAYMPPWLRCCWVTSSYMPSCVAGWASGGCRPCTRAPARSGVSGGSLTAWPTRTHGRPDTQAHQVASLHPAASLPRLHDVGEGAQYPHSRTLW
ncbi:Extracellular Matrix Protein 2 [Manis pentadactyla]|nr:Extracellular Matrix Protein 2 [Manis pentadactyla]